MAYDFVVVQVLFLNDSIVLGNGRGVCDKMSLQATESSAGFYDRSIIIFQLVRESS